MHQAQRLAIPLAGALALTLTACGGANTTAADTTPGHAVTVRNCGRDITVSHRLERAVTTEQAPTEALLALGLQDRMVGTSNLKTSVLPAYREAYAKVPVLTPKILTPEQTLSARPDIVVSSYASLLSKDRAGTIDELAAHGIATYLYEGQCPKAARTITDPVEAAYADTTNLGRLFGVEATAARIVADQKARVAKHANHHPTSTTPRLAWVYSAYDGLPYVAGGEGMPSALSKRLGAVNVFDDVADQWPEVQWEQLAARNPDVIVIADLTDRGRPGDRPEEKIKALRENPATASIPAVKEGRFVVVPGPAMDASIRFPDALDTLSTDLVRRGLIR